MRRADGVPLQRASQPRFRDRPGVHL